VAARGARAAASTAGDRFAALLLHARIMIALLGFIVGILLAFAWEYL
jgi:hypothetical protein